MTSMRLSIVVPVFNERYLVGEMLRRLLALEIDGLAAVEIIVVDDGSTDGSRDIAQALADAHPERIRLIAKEENGGKGSAIRAGINAATGDLIVFQDADLEYDPRDFQRMLRPFVEDGADVVYGSRFASSDRRRVLYFRHSLGNRLITFLSNLFTDLNLTDVETCYKMFRGPLLKSIPLRSNDFSMEIELTAKIAKRNCIVYEVPISYRGRTYREGKKIGWRDGVGALLAVFRFWLIDDLYKEDAYGGQILHSLDKARRFNRWMADVIRPWLGDRVLEIGAGIGNITSELLPREQYLATDINSSYLHYLRNYSEGKPYLSVDRVDLEDESTFAPHAGKFDTVICLNVLEHVGDPMAAVRNLFSALEVGGQAVVYVPRGQRLYSSLDEALGHRRRYEAASLRAELEEGGFEVVRLFHFNRVSVPGWWFNGKILRRRTLSRIQLKIMDVMVPLLRIVDRLLPWKGLGIVAIARKPADGTGTRMKPVPARPAMTRKRLLFRALGTGALGLLLAWNLDLGALSSAAATRPDPLTRFENSIGSLRTQLEQATIYGFRGDDGQQYFWVQYSLAPVLVDLSAERQSVIAVVDSGNTEALDLGKEYVVSRRLGDRLVVLERLQD